MAQRFLARARATGGTRVIQITDQKLANPNPDFFSYTMSKHALGATIAMLSQGRGDPRDRVYGLAPGAILRSHDQSEEETEISHRLNLFSARPARRDRRRGAVPRAGLARQRPDACSSTAGSICSTKTAT